MSTRTEELLKIAEQSESTSANLIPPEANEQLQKLADAADKIGKAWSGSWLGYHSRVYYQGLEPPPPGARFSAEWGLIPTYFIRETVGDWAEYDTDSVRSCIYKIAGDPDLNPIKELIEQTRARFEDNRAEIISVPTTALEEREDEFVAKLKAEAEEMKFPSPSNFICLTMQQLHF